MKQTTRVLRTTGLPFVPESIIVGTTWLLLSPSYGCATGADGGLEYP